MPYELPRDSNGSVQAHDHPDVKDDHVIIRKISDQHVINDPKVEGGRRISSAAVNASTSGSKGMSVDLEALIISAGYDPYQHVTTPKWIGSIQFTAQTLRALAYQVGQDPLPENPFHGEVWGAFTKPRQKQLLKSSKWYVEIPQVVLNPV